MGSFVEKIPHEEIEILQMIGKGSYGQVMKGKWKSQIVAVKEFAFDADHKSFLIEVNQLSCISHPNIITLFGSCIREKGSPWLIMEYADGGSLHNVLHGHPRYYYNSGHAVNWALQIAKGVSYLHEMKPKALIHRDLKPLNLLLTNQGQLIKICDFGCACFVHTDMTDNKGSAAWMAPEVFQGIVGNVELNIFLLIGCQYTEKCDVFSWSIILWEILTRRQPFAYLDSSYSILWAINNGERPPLIQNCPLPLECLMIRCWHKDPSDRPSMIKVVEVISSILHYFPGFSEPLTESVLNENKHKTEDSSLKEMSVSTSYEDFQKYPYFIENIEEFQICTDMNRIVIPELPPVTCKIPGSLPAAFSVHKQSVYDIEKFNFLTKNLNTAMFYPLKPLPNNTESVQIYKDHIQLLQEHERQKLQISNLIKMKNLLSKELFELQQ